MRIMYSLPLEYRSLYLDGGYESRGHIGTEQGRHVQLPHISLLSQGAGDTLLAQQLQTGHPVLHTYHVQCWPTCQEQTRVSVTPTYGGDGSLKESLIDKDKNVSFLDVYLLYVSMSVYCPVPELT